MVRIPTNRVPTHPGEMLLEEFLNPLGLTQRELAAAIRVPYQRVNELVNGRRSITPSTALRLAKYFDVSPAFWLNLQLPGICIMPPDLKPGTRETPCEPRAVGVPTPTTASPTTT